VEDLDRQILSILIPDDTHVPACDRPSPMMGVHDLVANLIQKSLDLLGKMRLHARETPRA
jgi:hypothetical protein